MPVSSLGNILLIDDNPKLIKDTLGKNYQNIDLVLGLIL